MEGWISIDRSIINHWIYKDEWKFKCWIDLLLKVNHTESKVNIKGEIFICGIGETLRSLDTFSKEWNCSKSKVRRFLKLLQSDSMIVLKDERKTTRITICNYVSYQSMRNANETQTKRKRNANETQVTPNNNDNNDNKNNKPIDWDGLILFFNKTFGKKSKIVSNKVKQSYLARIKDGYTKEDIIGAMISASKNDFHKDNNFKHCTLEFFSRQDKLDKFSSMIITDAVNHKPRRPDITGAPALSAIKVPAMMQSLVNKGWTEEEVRLVASGDHDGVGGLDY